MENSQCTLVREAASVAVIACCKLDAGPLQGCDELDCRSVKVNPGWSFAFALGLQKELILMEASRNDKVKSCKVDSVILRLFWREIFFLPVLEFSEPILVLLCRQLKLGPLAADNFLFLLRT